MDNIGLDESGVYWRQDGWGLRIREPALVGKRQQLRGYVDVFYRDKSGQVTLNTTAETAPLVAADAAAFLATVDPKGVLFHDLLRLANAIRERLKTLPTEQQASVEGRAPDLVQMSTIEPEHVQFLWDPYIPLGKITMLEGDPGVGKTWLALGLCATVSSGGAFLDADGKPTLICEPGNVIYMSAEDGLADTLRNRLDSAGANVERVYALTGWKSESGESGAVTLKDIALLRDAMGQIKPRLVIVDPVQAYLGAGVDMHRANGVRPILAGLANLAAEYGTAIILIRHLSKSLQAQDLYRGMGSIDFTAAARSVIAVGLDPDDRYRHVMVHLKSSLAEIGSSLAFSLTQGQFNWLGKTELTASDLLGPQRGNDNKHQI